VNKVVIDAERCKGCYLCIEACPKNVIEISDCLNAGGCYPARPSKDGQCTACAFCATVCPDTAIEVYRDVKNN